MPSAKTQNLEKRPIGSTVKDLTQFYIIVKRISHNSRLMEGVLSRFDVIHFMDISINNDSHKKKLYSALV